ncbi:MAG: hypothetical protein PHC75_05830 [Burkholderiales bacterium]|nr:hypothetical protein [Burkholderiales bacterium]
MNTLKNNSHNLLEQSPIKVYDSYVTNHLLNVITYINKRPPETLDVKHIESFIDYHVHMIVYSKEDKFYMSTTEILKLTMLVIKNNLRLLALQSNVNQSELMAR